MSSIGVLKQELINLERNAETLERIVFSDLTALETLPEGVAEKYQAKVLRKLHRLDELQEEIDATVAKLKEAGGYEPRTYSAKVYEYRPPKYERPKPPKKKPKAERKVYPVESPTPVKLRKRTPKPPRVRKPVQPKPKSVRPAPKPRKPAESAELKLAKKRRDKARTMLRQLDAQIEAKRLVLLRRIEERKAKVLEVADIPNAEYGPQKRQNARNGLATAEQRLRDLDKHREERGQRILELIAKADQEIAELLEKDSQLI